MSKITNLPPDPRLYNWPYAPESDVPESLHVFEYFETLADIMRERIWKDYARQRAMKRSAEEMKWKLLGTPFHHKRTNQGEHHPQSKLTTVAIKTIRALTNLRDKDLAEMFEVSPSQINRIRNRKAWRHLK